MAGEGKKSKVGPRTRLAKTALLGSVQQTAAAPNQGFVIAEPIERTVDADKIQPYCKRGLQGLQGNGKYQQPSRCSQEVKTIMARWYRCMNSSHR